MGCTPRPTGKAQAVHVAWETTAQASSPPSKRLRSWPRTGPEPEREQTLHQPLPARTCKGTSEALFRLGRHFMLINRAMLRIGKKKELGPCMACRAAGVISSGPSQSFPDQLPHNCIERAS